MSGPTTMSDQDAKINPALSDTNTALTKSIHYMSTDPKYAHRLLELIKMTSHEEDDIYIASVTNLHYFIMLDIVDLFEKIKNSIQNNPLYPSSDTIEKNTTTFLITVIQTYNAPPLCMN